MLTKPNILVATDFSEFSHLALKAGEEIRLKTGGQLQLVHVSSYPDQWDWMTNDVVFNYYPQEFKSKLMDEIKARMEKQMRDSEATGSLEIVFGPVFKSLLNHMTKFHADLLIIGHRGAGNHFHLGSLTAKMLTASDRPVLVINRAFKTRKIAGLIDTNKIENDIFSLTQNLGALFSSEIEFVSVWPDLSRYSEFPLPDKETESKMKKSILSQIDPDWHVNIVTRILDDKSVSEGLVEILDETDVDLAVMTRHQKSRLEKIFLGSVTRGVLDRWKGNFLVTPPTK
jgi:nucleotide-binding universal stress UspA family protein